MPDRNDTQLIDQQLDRQTGAEEKIFQTPRPVRWPSPRKSSSFFPLTGFGIRDVNLSYRTRSDASPVIRFTAPQGNRTGSGTVETGGGEF